MLSMVYRASKLFGGILIILGIMLIFFAFMFGVGILNFGVYNQQTIIVLSTLCAIFIIISGIFHYLKS